MPPLEPELRRLRAFALLTYPFACVPFLFLYFAAHGVDEGGYGTILGAYYGAMFLAEVPTGMLADRIGARRMLIAGPCLLTMGFATLLVAPSYGGFVVGEALLGVGHAVLSGPPTVLLYETLRAHGQQHRYLAEESRINGRRLAGTGASFLLGGLLVRYGNPGGDAFALSIVATCIGTVLAAGIAFRLSDVPRAEEPGRRGFVRAARRELAKPGVAWLLLYWVVLFALLRFPFHDYQPYLRDAAAQEPWFGNQLFVGLVYALLNFAAAPMSTLLPRLVARVGRRPLFWALPLVLCASLLVMAAERWLATSGALAPTAATALAWIGLTMFFVQQVPFGMHWALVHEFVNHRIGSTARTTVLSALSLGARAVYAPVNVALFALQEARGIAVTLGTAGLAGSAAVLAVMLLRPRGLLRGREPLG